jgi:ribonuclease HII
MAPPAPSARGVRLQSPLDYERELWSRGIRVIAGIEEVGRGPLAGPVVAAAVILPLECEICGAYDSKSIPAQLRDTLAVEIAQTAIAVGIGAASPLEIDLINIRRATALAMRRAIQQLRITPQHLLVDGLPVPELGLEWQTAVVEGDRRVHSIACASIVAKVCRDRLMRRLALRYPDYAWESNKGYGTPAHLEALHRLGATPHHRRSFQPIEQLELVCEP